MKPGDELKLSFVTETNVDKKVADLSGVEINKIQGGHLHFKAVSDDIRFE